VAAQMMVNRRGCGSAIASAAALAYLLIMFVSGTPPMHGNRVAADDTGVIDVAPADINRISLTAGHHSRTLARDTAGWRDEAAARPLTSDETETLAAAISLMRNAPPIRVLRPEETADVDAAAYGLDPPSLSVRLDSSAGPLVVADFGGRANDGIVQYLRIEGRGETFMMSGFVGEAWSKLLVAR
jgi:hypothetical protein